MNAILCRAAVFFGIISIVTGCQTSRLATDGSAGRSGSRSTATRQVMLHDSQGPQATRVTMTAAEAAAFRRQ